MCQAIGKNPNWFGAWSLFADKYCLRSGQVAVDSPSRAVTTLLTSDYFWLCSTSTRTVLCFTVTMKLHNHLEAPPFSERTTDSTLKLRKKCDFVQSCTYRKGTNDSVSQTELLCACSGWHGCCRMQRCCMAAAATDATAAAHVRVASGISNPSCFSRLNCQRGCTVVSVRALSSQYIATNSSQAPNSTSMSREKKLNK